MCPSRNNPPPLLPCIVEYKVFGWETSEFTFYLSNQTLTGKTEHIPVEYGCLTVAPELELFHLEREAVSVSFPIFLRALHVRHITPPDAAFRIAKGNLTHDGDEGRVRRLGLDLWLLPAQPSDSGEYTCTFRNATYCIRGSVTLRVYAKSAVDVDNLSFEYDAMLGENVTLNCPIRKHYSHTHVQWFKGAVTLQSHRWHSSGRDARKLWIPEVQRSDGGLYTCRLSVLVERSEFPLTRTIRLLITEPQFATPSMPPLIISPSNGSVHQASHGSGLEVKCTVLTSCQSSPWTGVWWYADGVQVDASRLHGRSLQTGRRETRVGPGCQVEVGLVIMSMTEEEEGAELTCVTQNQDGRREVTVTLHLEDSSTTWLVVACVSIFCFLAVLSIFLYALLIKPKLKKNTKKNADYFLARQDSVC
ncbi:interleukin-1 receptor type 2 isoform X1 [Syngnathus typhle]|uniref:interleukin-1 receptor type 2 isoform X1 n=1 Tax=Syngnathus typhle TaxID=161592 RepID=UPI002A6A99F6|nr:interleukin-1 receptor type 2 isoform X1 [Syngnathus typhle]